MSLHDPEYFEWRQQERRTILVELITLAVVCLAAGIAIGAKICEAVCTQ